MLLVYFAVTYSTHPSVANLVRELPESGGNPFPERERTWETVHPLSFGRYTSPGYVPRRAQPPQTAIDARYCRKSHPNRSASG